MDFLDIDDSIEEFKRSDGVGETTLRAAKILGIATLNVAIFAGNEIFSGRAGSKLAEIVEKEKERLEK